MSCMALYTRVSTQEQASKGVSLENQLERGIRKAQSLGLEWQHFEDAGISGGTIEDRPSLKRLLEEIGTKKITHIYFYDIDRLSRGDVFQWGMLKRIFKENGIKVYDDNSEIKLDDDGSMLMTDIKQLFAAYERSKTRGKIITNLEDNARKGKWGGGKMLPYGYMRAKDKMLVINENEVEMINTIYKMSLDNKGIRVISNYLNEKKYPTRTGKKWRDGTVYRILTNPLYYGKRLYKGIELDAPAIISKKVFDMVQLNLTKNMSFKADKKYFYLLKGLVRCSKCGKTYYGKRREDLKDKSYTCISSRYTAEWCGNRGIDIDYLEGVVTNSLRDLPNHIEKFYNWFEKNDMIISVMRDIKRCRVRENELVEKLDKLVDMYTDAEVPRSILNSKAKKWNEELEEVKSKKLLLLPQLNLLDKKDVILKDIKKLVNDIDKLDNESKQNLVRSLVDKVSVLWVEEKKYHLIVIEYKIDNLTDYKLKLDKEVYYNSRGWRLDKGDTITRLEIRQIGSDVYVNVR